MLLFIFNQQETFVRKRLNSRGLMKTGQNRKPEMVFGLMTIIVSCGEWCCMRRA